MAKRIISIGADHGGFLLKEILKKALKEWGYKVEDEGVYSDKACDYPIFGFNVAKKVSSKEAYRGIVICKTGIGMSVIANKLPGVRAGLCHTIEDALSARQHNDTNVLALSAKKNSKKKAVNIVKTWLETKALKGRHARRVRKIKEFEKKVFK
ncbi:MAG: ribose 5-phosphate isomerase B [Candidatus Omnitrophota bacterium]|nr:ribose 5-phosphate isomerase B [Candidatus Omnitrophota bacterium]